MKTGRTLLIVASSENSADLIYATKFFVPDEIIWFRHKGKSYAVLSPLEINRARATADIDVCLAADAIARSLKKKGQTKTGTRHMMVEVLKQRGIRSVSVPASFPVAYAQALAEAEIEVEILEPFFPDREIKTAAEIRLITLGQRHAEAGLQRGLEILKAARIGANKTLKWGGGVLTSEILRGEIDAAVIKAGGLPAYTIVAGGNQGCDPHERGSGTLKAHQSIILDIFPRDQKSGYFGDLTRTVVKGRASEALRRLHATVAKGQQMAFSEMREGCDGAVLHEEIKSFFKKEGFPTEERKGRWVGFFHGTGHSLGLEIHEAPRFSAGTFRAGHVMTVEPGLYYPGVGGVRIEDLVVIRKNAITNLTKAPSVFEL